MLSRNRELLPERTVKEKPRATFYGYCRVSTVKQSINGNSLEEQEETILRNYPQAEITREAYSGAKERPLFSELLEKLQPGDTLIVTKLDRFCRSTKDGLNYIDMLMNKNVKVHILNMGLIENTPMGRLIVTNLLAFAEFERAMILERTQGGKEVARATKPNFKEGRKPLKINQTKFDATVERYRNGELTSTEAAKVLGISRSSFFKYMEV